MTVLGMAACLANFARAHVAAEIAAEASASVAKTEVTETAKGLAPVATGALRDSIATTEDGVIVEADYAVFVEFGTSESSAQPFLRPAIDEVKEPPIAAAAARVIGAI